MTSLQRRLTARVLVATLTLSAAAGMGVYAYARTALIKQFDAATTGKARAFGALLEIEPSGVLEVEFSGASLPEYYSPSPDRFFELRRGDGSVMVSSPALNGRALLPAGMSPVTSHAFNLDLPGGRPGRAIVLRIAPWLEPADPAKVRVLPANPEQFTLVLARDRGELDRTLNHLLSALLLAGAALAGATALAVVMVVRKSMRPVQDVAQRAAQIDAASIDKRLPVDGLAAELRPISQCINELLDRVEAGFKRERQFTSSVAHELRTPIAELRALAEVGIQRAAQRGVAPEPQYRDALDIAMQMQSIVTSLLALARCHSNSQIVSPQPIDLGELIAGCWRKHAPAADPRGLRTETQLAAGAVIANDRALLSAMLENVFSNAIEYTPRGGTITCRLDRRAGQAMLEISNNCTTLEPADLPRMCEPFWRKDTARSSSTHSGLGMAMVDAYAKLLGIGMKLRLKAYGVFVVSLSFETCAEVPDSDAKPAPGAPVHASHAPGVQSNVQHTS
jgi:signal transduction histidine kinase